MSIGGKTEKAKSTSTLLELIFYTKEDINVFYWGGRILIYAAMLWFAIQFIASPIESNFAGISFMHMINLPFHEAGHIFLRPFGSLITSLGGSIFQLLAPVICLFVLLVQTRDTFGASVALWWFGQNFFDMAPYIDDARSLSLPLVGGNYGHSSPYGFHDWEYILTETGLLQYDHLLARTSIAFGTLCFILSLIWGAVVLYKQFKNLE
ncbi:zinc ribbon domain-containing protein [Desulfosediminicola flagellatus]|uniref:zinc ribbon domain-containing protein n=1 Tax=Desulfosediminicola flagellatus TaxID=2569541 RepID=UPI001E4085AD|nr:zinc ribbon domain-containing protein [Desulfosediminicola flagellatus]